MPRVIDQMGRTVVVPDFPQRIISLVPSQTELLFDLGLGDRVVGITKFCIHPAIWRKQKAIVGGTKQYKFDAIAVLKPDLIIGNKEENEKDGIDRLTSEFPVWMSDIANLGDALSMIKSIGGLVGKDKGADEMVMEISKSFSSLSVPSSVKKSLYLIWKRPYMAAGKDTFIHEMMNVAGFENVLTEGRYPELNIDQVKALNPEVVLLSSEPYPFKEKDIQEIQEVLPLAEVKLVDGEMFSWYGSRLKEVPNYFKSLK